MASNKAIMVDPVQAHEKASDLAGRRAAHAERAFAGGTVDDLKALAASGYRAKCFYLDPNWDFRTRSPAGDGRSANVHYNTAAVEQIIRDLEAVPAMAAEDSAMLLWMVDWAPRAALDLIEALGFEHKTTAFTWAKQNEDGDGWHMGQGYWTRANPEDCWLATKGQPKRLHADVRQLVVAPVMEHSRKPDLYDEIERLVEGPYLELYARRPRKGWTSWGNELEFTGVAA
jgi:N6-adenosine-specific RNA methylase IME4